MKTTSNCPLGLWRGAALGAALILTGGLSSLCHAQSSPVGTWDCLMSGGGQPGVAYITFTSTPDANGNPTFYGYQITAGTPSTSEVSERTPNGDVGRTSPTNTSPKLLVFGATAINGPWGYDSQGRVIGSFTQLLKVTSTGLVTNFLAGSEPESITNSSNPSEITNIVAVFTAGSPTYTTNYQWATNTEIYVFNNPFVSSASSEGATNQVSFVGKVVPGKHLTLNTSSLTGHTTYRGVPAVTLPDLSGSQWNGVKKQQGVSYVEFFQIQSFRNGVPPGFPDTNIVNFPNIYYSTNGVGPGYDFDSIIIISSQKKAGLAMTESTGGGSILRATYGGFTSNAKTTTSNSKGLIEPGISISYKAQKQ